MILIFNPNGWCLQVRWRYWIWSKVALEEEALRRCRKELRKGANCSKCALVLSHSCALAALRKRTTIELMQSTSARWKAKTSSNSSACALLVEDLRYWIWSKVALEEEALRKCRVLEQTWCLCLSSMEICSCEVENWSRHAFALVHNFQPWPGDPFVQLSTEFLFSIKHFRFTVDQAVSGHFERRQCRRWHPRNSSPSTSWLHLLSPSSCSAPFFRVCHEKTT